MACCGKKPSNRKLSIAPKIRHLKSKTVFSAQSFLKYFVVCRPTFYDIKYQINPWMNFHGFNKNMAIDQWNSFCDRIKEFGAEVLQVKPREDLPDMTFTSDNGLFLKSENIFVVSNHKHEERSREQWWFHEFFFNRNASIITTANYFCGSDAVFFEDTLIGGYGFRTDKELYDEIRPLLDKDPIVVKLVNPYFFTLNSCFCPLNNSDYLIYEDAFDEFPSLGRKISVPGVEAKNFACSSLVIGNKVLISKNCPITCEKLKEFGYEPVELEMSELMKSGGACKALALEI
jgi:N-dimethylarginine dimethylaminohydrolase